MMRNVCPDFERTERSFHYLRRRFYLQFSQSLGNN